MHGSFKWKHLKNGVWRVLLKPQSHRCFQNGTPKFRSRDWKSHTENWRFGYCAGLHRWENSWLRTKHIHHFHGIWTHHIKKVVKCCWVFPFHFFSVAHLLLGLKLGLHVCLFFGVDILVGGRNTSLVTGHLFLVFLVRRKRVPTIRVISCFMPTGRKGEGLIMAHGPLLFLAKDMSSKPKGKGYNDGPLPQEI